MLCLPMDCLDLNHGDRQIASRETITMTNDNQGGNPATTTAVHRIVI